jgi:hypothetical protein
MYLDGSIAFLYCVSSSVGKDIILRLELCLTLQKNGITRQHSFTEHYVARYVAMSRPS